MIIFECKISTGSVCFLDFDIIINGQDYCDKIGFTVLKVTKKKGAYILSISDGCDSIPYDMVLISENGGFVIDNFIYYDRESTLDLKELLKKEYQ